MNQHTKAWKERRKLEKEIREADRKPPERVISNLDELLDYLAEDDDCPPITSNHRGTENG